MGFQYQALKPLPTPKTPAKTPAPGFEPYPQINMGKPAVDHHAIRAVVGHMAAVQSPQDQAKAMVDAELAPLLAHIRSGYLAQGKQGASAIQALTSQYASQMGQLPGQIAGIYAPAEQATAATNAALADRLSGAGQQSSDDLAARLASIQEPGAVNPAAAQLAQAGAGAGNALFATGNASLDQLIANAASGQAYAAKQPGIARLAGLQNLTGFEGSLAAAQGKDIADLTGKAPGLIQSAYGTLTSANNAAASRAQSASQFATGQASKAADRQQSARQFNATQAGKRLDRQASAAKNAATLQERRGEFNSRQKLAADKANADRRVKLVTLAEKQREFAVTSKQKQAATDFLNWYRKQQVGVDVAKVQQKAAEFGVTSAQKQQSLDTAATKAAASIEQGNTRLAQTDERLRIARAHEAAYEKAAASKTNTTASLRARGGLTANAWSSLKDKASKQADVFYNGVPPHQHYNTTTSSFEPVPGTGQDFTPYPEALRKLIALGPNTPAWRAQAAALLNARFKPGEGGRPKSQKQLNSQTHPDRRSPIGLAGPVGQKGK